MPRTEDIQEMTPGTSFNDADKSTHYWINGSVMMYRHYPIRGADIKTFRFYRGAFAKDLYHCYVTSKRLAGGNAQLFRALNYTYATDGNFVWTLGGKVKGSDAASFSVCDDGVYSTGRSRFPYGYGKDRSHVFYYDFDGKPNLVKKANAETFQSLNDGFFGIDNKTVFCGRSTIAKADVKTWNKIGGFYSKDKNRIFYFNRIIPEAHLSSFRVIPSQDGFTQLARDRNHFYWNDRIIDKDEQGIKIWIKCSIPDIPGDYPSVK